MFVSFFYQTERELLGFAYCFGEFCSWGCFLSLSRGLMASQLLPWLASTSLLVCSVFLVASYTM
jgi:hypothetical protein